MVQQLALFDDAAGVAAPVAALDLVAQERAALVTSALYSGERLTFAAVQQRTGLTYYGAWYLMMKLARVLPVTYDPETRVWQLIER